MSSKFLLGDIRVHLASRQPADRMGDGDALPGAGESYAERLGPQAPAKALLSPGTSSSAPGAMQCPGKALPTPAATLALGLTSNPKS